MNKEIKQLIDEDMDKTIYVKIVNDDGVEKFYEIDGLSMPLDAKNWCPTIVVLQ